jgi:hypothetical protein
MGVSFVRPILKSMKAVVPTTVASTSAGAVKHLPTATYGENFAATIMCTTGIIYISTLTTAPTSTNGYEVKERETIDLNVPSNLAIIGNSTTAAYQAIVWNY